MKNQKSFSGVKLGALLLVTVCSVLLPGATTSRTEIVSDEQQAMQKIQDVVTVAIEQLPAEKQQNFGELSSNSPLLMLELNSQSFDAQQHQALWQ